MINAFYFSLTTLWAVWPDKHNPTLIAHYKLLFFIFLAYCIIDSSARFERMLWTFLCGNFYLGWVAHTTGRQFDNRLEGIGPADTGGDGNATAAIMISCIPILLFYLLKGKRWQKVVSLGFLAYVMDGIILVNSRGAFVGMIVSLGYFTYLLVFRNKGGSGKQRAAVVTVLIIGLLSFFYLADETFWKRMGTIENEAQSDYGGSGRRFFWMKSLDLVKEHPFGVGVWGYQYLSPQFIPEELLARGLKRRAEHSLYFQCLAERGYLGLTLFLFLVFSNFRFIWKVKKRLKEVGDLYHFFQACAIEAGYLAFLTASIFLSNLHMEVLYWFMLFIGTFGVVFSRMSVDVGQGRAIADASSEVQDTWTSPSIR